MDDFINTAEDYFIDDEAEEIEDAMEDLIEDDYSDIDNIADIDEESEYDDFEDEESEYDDFEDEESDDYVEYEIPNNYDYQGGF